MRKAQKNQCMSPIISWYLFFMQKKIQFAYRIEPSPFWIRKML